MRQCLECGLKLALRAHLYVDRKLVFHQWVLIENGLICLGQQV